MHCILCKVVHSYNFCKHTHAIRHDTIPMAHMPRLLYMNDAGFLGRRQISIYIMRPASECRRERREEEAYPSWRAHPSSPLLPSLPPPYKKNKFIMQLANGVLRHTETLIWNELAPCSVNPTGLWGHHHIYHSPWADNYRKATSWISAGIIALGFFFSFPFFQGL